MDIYHRFCGPVDLPHKYYLNTVTRTVNKHTATVVSCYHINSTYIYIYIIPQQKSTLIHFLYSYNRCSLCALTCKNDFTQITRVALEIIVQVKFHHKCTRVEGPTNLHDAKRNLKKKD